MPVGRRLDVRAVAVWEGQAVGRCGKRAWRASQDLIEQVRCPVPAPSDGIPVAIFHQSPNLEAPRRAIYRQGLIWQATETSHGEQRTQGSTSSLENSLVKLRQISLEAGKRAIAS